MAAPAKAKSQTLEEVYHKLHTLLSGYAPPFKPTSGQVRDKLDLHLVAPKPVAIEGIYENKPKPVGMASIILQRGYVGFYYLPVYLKPALKDKLSPALRKTLQGKTCFHIKKLDDEMLAAVQDALEVGTKFFRDAGWID